MLKDLTIEEFLKEVASKKPAPGGGSVAALGGALAAALVSKAAVISGDEKIAEKSERLGKVLKNLIDEDAEAFQKVMEAYRLPKKPEAKEKARKDAIEKALQRATEVPLQTARYSHEILKLADILAEKCSQNVFSDVGVAAWLAKSSIISAVLNVQVNFASIKDEEFKKKISEGLLEFDKMFEEAL